MTTKLVKDCSEICLDKNIKILHRDKGIANGVRFRPELKKNCFFFVCVLYMCFFFSSKTVKF